ncbi:MAG: serine hydrolase domain-containing protein [Chitinophagales bacterium]
MKFRLLITLILLFYCNKFVGQSKNASTSKMEQLPVNLGKLQYAKPEQTGMIGQLLQDSIAAIIKEGIEGKAFPGAQVLVAKDGHIVYHEAFGFHTYDKEQVLQKTDIYDLASVSKITTALPALMKLKDEGKFDLEGKLVDYVPKLKKSNKADLGIRPVLAHHARLKAWIPFWQNTVHKDWPKQGQFKKRTLKSKSSRAYSVKVTPYLWLHRKYGKTIFKAIKDSPLNEKEGYKYSGLSFYLWPSIIEKLTKTDYEKYLKTEFYRPLEAHTLTFNPWRYYTLNQIVPTEKDTFFRKTLLHGYVHDEGAAMMGGVNANAGLFGNATDLAKLMQMYLNGGVYDGRRYISEATLKEFTQCQYCEEGNRRGLGFDKPLIVYNAKQSSTAKDASPDSFGHSGYTGTFVWADPKHNLLYIFLSNRVYPTRNNPKIYRLNIRPRIHEVIYKSLVNKK